PNGQCWNMTNRDLGFGYWGDCPQGANVPGRARSARAAVQTGPGVPYPYGATEEPETTGPLVSGGPAPRAAVTTGRGSYARAAVGPRPATGAGAPYPNGATEEPNSPGPLTSSSASGPGYAYVNSPGPNGQCWQMTNRDLGFGYWGACPQGTTGAPRAARRAARVQ